MRYRAAILVFSAWVIASPVPSHAQEFDILTASCLIGYENDDHPEICAQVDPGLADAVREAKRKWQARNAERLRELQKACAVRLLRAYRDAATIEQAKGEARRWRAGFRAELLNDPNRANRVNCRAYAEDFARGNDRIDVQRWMIDQTRDSPAQAVKWP
jgi:hypothetical protein